MIYFQEKKNKFFDEFNSDRCRDCNDAHQISQKFLYYNDHSYTIAYPSFVVEFIKTSEEFSITSSIIQKKYFVETIDNVKTAWYLLLNMF